METHDDISGASVNDMVKRIDRNLKIYRFLGLLWDYECINLPDGRLRVFFKYPAFLETSILYVIAGRGGYVEEVTKKGRG